MSDKERIANEADVQAHRRADAADDQTGRTDPEKRAETEGDEPDVEGHRVTPRITPRTST